MILTEFVLSTSSPLRSQIFVVQIMKCLIDKITGSYIVHVLAKLAGNFLINQIRQKPKSVMKESERIDFCMVTSYNNGC